MAIRFILITVLFILFPYQSKADGIMKKKVWKKGDMFEVVRYAKGIEEINVYKEEKKPYYTPSEKILTFYQQPQCFHTSHGYLCLYDLSRNHIFLNALKYDYIEIEGNITGLKLGIADKTYYEKQDHIALPSNNIIDLSFFFNKVDLSRLKYITTLAKDQNETLPLKIRFLQLPVKNKTPERSCGVWIWNPQKASIDKIKLYRFDTLYVQMKKGFSTLVKNIENTSLSIYGLNGSPDDIWHYDHLLSNIEQLGKLKKTYHQIRGYQVDIEPYLLKGFSEKRQKIWQSYISMLKVLAKKAHEAHLRFCAVIPYWFDTVYIDNGKNLAFEVFNIVDEVVLMSYRSDLLQVHRISEPIIAYGKFLKKQVYIGLELMKIDDEEHTRYRVKEKAPYCLDSEGNISSCFVLDKIAHYVVKGSEISFYGQTEKLQQLTEHNLGFGGYVLHYLDILPDKGLCEK